MGIKVAVVGASGYTGGELLRILAQHPEVEVEVATSREYKGLPVHHVHFNLRGYYKTLRFTNPSPEEIASRVDAVFLAVPHGVSLKYAPVMLEHGVRVVDLSADFRLKNPRLYEVWYGYKHPYPDLLEKAVYGLPELHRSEIRSANLVASPGCNATAAILALAPLVKSGLIELDKPILIDVKAGSSEAGAKPSKPDHHPEREGCIRPYSTEGHRHVAEVEQELSLIAGREVTASLTPHAVSSVRGVLATCYCRASGELTDIEVLRAYASMYAKEFFIRVIHKAPPGSPDPKYVVGSNYADVGFALEPRVGVVKAFAAIDNLVRGAAGQAVQAFNIMFNLDEKLGLNNPPLKPV